jgi:hypothetical protein
VPADARLEHRLGDRRREQVVLRRLDVAEPLGEHLEGAVERRVDDDPPAHDGVLGHELSSEGCPTASA